jgi:hypothetical protein
MKSFAVAALSLLALPSAFAGESAQKISAIATTVDSLSKSAYAIVEHRGTSLSNRVVSSETAANLFINTSDENPSAREITALNTQFASLGKAGAIFATTDRGLSIVDVQSGITYEVIFDGRYRR